MKGLALNIRIGIVIAFTIGITMAILSIYPSWSQYAGNVQDPLLYTTLFAIAMVYMMSSFTNNKHIIQIAMIDVRFEHLARVISYSFGGVIVFSVNSESEFIYTLHIIFTAIAIGAGYFLLLFYYDNTKQRTLSILGGIVGICGFLIGFLFNIYSVAWAEVIASVPLAIFLWDTSSQQQY